MGSMRSWHFGLVIPGSQSMLQSEILKQEHCPVFWARNGKLRSSVFIIGRSISRLQRILALMLLFEATLFPVHEVLHLGNNMGE